MKQFQFPIRVSRSGAYFEDQDGVPFLWHADTCWRIFWMLTYEEACRYLDDRAEKGFTVIQVHMLPHHIYQTNRYGENPFAEPGRIDEPNEKYFARADRIIEYAGEKGLAVAIAPMWLSTWEDDWYRYYRGDAVRKYSRMVAGRYGRFENVIAFIHGGDDDAFPLHGEINECARICKQEAPHVLATFHAGIKSGAQFFGDEDWYDFCMNYTYDYSTCIRQMLDSGKKYPAKPAILGETHYDGNDGITPFVIRRFAYTSVILGGAGHTYGNKEIWQASMFLEDAMYTAAVQHMMTLKEVMGSFAWYDSVPDMEGSFFTTLRALMPNASDEYIPAAKTKDGRETLAYVSDVRYFAVNGTGQYDASWTDPVSGRAFRFRSSCGERIHIPGRNAGGDFDWILHVCMKHNDVTDA